MAVNHKAMNAYKDVQVSSAVSYADGVQLIQMLFDGLMDALNDAETHIHRKDIAKKSDAISRATRIIVGLKGSLDFEKGGELARNLNDLYDYSSRQLLKANLRNDIELVQERIVAQYFHRYLWSLWAKIGARKAVETLQPTRTKTKNIWALMSPSLKYP